MSISPCAAPQVEDVVLQAGDVMLIEATDQFLTEFSHDKAFLLLLEVSA